MDKTTIDSKNMKKQKTRFVILGLLSIEPLSGYDIKKFIHRSISHFWSESNGQLYPALNQLLREKLIALDRIAHKGKKARHLYSITEQGQSILENWLAEKSEGKSSHRDEELLKIFFCKNVPTKVCLELLQGRKKKVQEKLETFKEIQEDIKKYSDSPDYRFWIFDLKNGLYRAEAELRWCDECINELIK